MATIEPREVRVKNGAVITLRSPEVADAEKFSAFLPQIFSTSRFLRKEPDEFVPDLDKQKVWISDLTDADGSICIIAEHDNKIVGNINLSHIGSKRRIAHRGQFGMSVLENWRGQGVGRRLLSRLIEWAKHDACPIEKIELMVVDQNVNAIALYESFGFKREGIIKSAVKYRDGQYADELMMGLFVNDRDQNTKTS